MARARTTRSAPNTRASRAAVPAVARTKPVNAERAPSGFDLLLLTVANDVQRLYAEQMLEIRKSLGTLPRGLATLVMADPAGKRIGSGGSTLLCLAELAKRGLLGMRGARILILHSGGDSRRLPSWSAPGKIWVPLGRTGRADSAATTDTAHRGLGPFNVPTLFDLILAELSRLTLPTSGGVLVASGDAGCGVTTRVSTRWSRTSNRLKGWSRWVQARASSSTSTQCRTGVLVPLCRCWMQPTLALTMACMSVCGTSAKLASNCLVSLGRQ